MKIITLCFLLLLFLSANSYANTLEGEFESLAAPEIDIESVAPTQETLDTISRLSEKYVMGTITEDELLDLKSLNGDFESLDVYKSEFEKSLQNNTNNTATIDNSALDKQVETVNTVQSGGQVKDEKKSPFSLFAFLIGAFTIINFTLLMYVIISQRRK